MGRVFCFVAVLVTFGCSSHRNPSNVEQFDAYSADDSKDRVPLTQEKYRESWEKHGGAIFVFKEGDIIDVGADANGDILESIDSSHIKVKRTLYFYAGNRAMMVSFDGKNYHPLKEVIQSGSFSITIDDKAKKNRLTFSAAPKMPTQ